MCRHKEIVRRLQRCVLSSRKCFFFSTAALAFAAITPSLNNTLVHNNTGNFTRESNIMARQRQYFNEMEQSMKPETMAFYDDYFARYVEYYSSVAGQNDLKRVTNSSIYDIFDNALLDVYPSTVYK